MPDHRALRAQYDNLLPTEFLKLAKSQSVLSRLVSLVEMHVNATQNSLVVAYPNLSVVSIESVPEFHQDYPTWMDTNLVANAKRRSIWDVKQLAIFYVAVKGVLGNIKIKMMLYFTILTVTDSSTKMVVCLTSVRIKILESVLRTMNDTRSVMHIF